MSVPPCAPFPRAQQHRAAARVDQAHDAARHRRLARARFADDAQRLAAADFKIHVLRGVHRAALAEPALVVVGLFQALDAQHDRRAVVARPLFQLQRRHGGHQHAGVVVARPAQHVVLRAEFDEVSQSQHRHAVRHLGNHAEVVRDEQHARAVALLQLEHELENLRLRRHVECGGGLVGDQQHRVEHQRHRDHDALALAAGELMWITRHHAFGFGQQHFADDAQHLGAPFGGRELRVFAQHFVDLVTTGHDRVQRRHRLLKDHRHARRAQFAQAAQRRMGDVFALQDDLAGGHRQGLGQQAHHALRDHRLAGTRLARPGREFRRARP